MTTGRVFADVGLNVNTGIALSNPNPDAATVSFYFTDTSGTNFGQGTATIPPRQQIAAFLNQPPFNGRSILGTFTFASSAPIAAVGLRGITNERGDFLMTTLPVAELGTTPPENTTIAHFADGGGWVTQVVLVNPSDSSITGTLQFIGRTGQILQTFPYTIAPRSAARIVTPGLTGDVQTGSVRISSPVIASSIFSFRLGGVTVTQAGMPALRAATAFRMYVENGSTVRSGIAIANPLAQPVDVTLQTAGLSTTLSIAANNQTALFLSEIPGFSSIPATFQGVLRMTSNTPIVVTGVRGHFNERGEFLIAATTPLDDSSPPVPETFFPYFAEGQGYSMEFIVFGRASSGTISFYDQAGNLTSLEFR